MGAQLVNMCGAHANILSTMRKLVCFMSDITYPESCAVYCGGGCGAARMEGANANPVLTSARWSTTAAINLLKLVSRFEHVLVTQICARSIRLTDSSAHPASDPKAITQLLVLSASDLKVQAD